MKSVQDQINNTPMSGFQVLAVTVCLAINMLDGYDVLVMSFTAPFVAEEWALSQTVALTCQTVALTCQTVAVGQAPASTLIFATPLFAAAAAAFLLRFRT